MQAFAQWRFVQLTLVILLYILLAPWLASLSILKLIAQIVLFNTLFVTVSTAPARKFDRRLKSAAWVLFALSFTASIVEMTSLFESWQDAIWYADLASSILVQIGCAAGILYYIARSRHVTIDNIFAAIVTYILIALVFAMVYLLIWQVNPSAFSLPPELSANSEDARVTMIYFSFVTMATLGYGDITATDPFARMVTIIEAMTGQFYVAILVGVLVGLYISHSTSRVQRD